MKPAAAAEPLTIGLTGGIGSGKSTVAAAWVARGAAVVDTDAIAHALTAAGGLAMPALRGAFGDAVADSSGALDRAAMRQRMLGDPGAKRTLEGVLHPMIGAEAQRQAVAARVHGRPAVVFDVPLLTESTHWRARCQRILVVDCPEATQVARVMARSGWSANQVERVIALQARRQARRAIADAVIHNDGLSLAELQAEVDQLWHSWGLDPRPRSGTPPPL